MRKYSSSLRILTRMFLWVCLGYLVENIWTGGSAVIDLISLKMLPGSSSPAKDYLSLVTKSYVWMVLVYGLGMMAYDWVADYLLLHRVSFFWRAVCYGLGFFGAEIVFGMAIRTITGIVPWDYSHTPWSRWYGCIRLDYFPGWCGLGLILEPVRPFLGYIQRGLLRILPRTFRLWRTRTFLRAEPAG